MRIPSLLLLLLLALSFACTETRATPTQTHAPSEPSEPANSEETADSPPPPPADPAAEAAATSLRERVGDPYAVDAIEFSFVVRSLPGDEGGEPAELLRRRYRWEPRTKRVTQRRPVEDVVVHYGDRDLGPFVADPHAHADVWAEVAPDTDPVVAAQAYAHFINDSFWLIAPWKLGDEGALRTMDEDRLQVRYASGGVTPGDEYVATLAPADADTEVAAPMTSWSFRLASGRSGTYSWAGWQRFGPLRLATIHRSDEGREIALEDVEVVVDANADTGANTAPSPDETAE